MGDDCAGRCARLKAGGIEAGRRISIRPRWALERVISQTKRSPLSALVAPTLLFLPAIRAAEYCPSAAIGRLRDDADDAQRAVASAQHHARAAVPRTAAQTAASDE